MMGPRETLYLEVEHIVDGEPTFARVGLVNAEVSPRTGWAGLIFATAVEDPVERIRALPFMCGYLVEVFKAGSVIRWRVTDKEGEAYVVPYYLETIAFDGEECLTAGRVAFEFSLAGAGAPVPARESTP